MRKKLLEYNYAEQVLLVDGPALTNILNTNNSSLFFEIARKAPAVICCRCLPTQKALITEKLKEITGSIVYEFGYAGRVSGTEETMWG
jgi:phospholipid-translocating ATPase